MKTGKGSSTREWPFILAAGALGAASFGSGPAFAVARYQLPAEVLAARGDHEAADEAAEEAAPRGGRAGRDVASVKGWIEALPGGRVDLLPQGARVIERYDDSAFIEIPAGAAAGLAARGLVFHPVPGADLLNVGGETFDARGGEPPLPPEWRAGAAGPGGRRPYLIKFDAPVRPEWIADLEAAGAALVQYQPHFGYLVFAPSGFEGRLGGVRHLAFNGEYHAAYKAAADLRSRAAGEETIRLRVVYFDLPGWEEKADALQRRGARLIDVSEGPGTSQWAVLRHALFENVRTRDLPSILWDPEVYWAEEWRDPEPEDERAAQITAGNITAGAPETGYHAWLAQLGTEGAGVTVTIADTGLDTGVLATLHEDMRGRTAFATNLCTQNRDRSGHGTNVASIAVGDPRLPNGTGLTDPGGFYWGAGSAPGASLYFQKVLDEFDCGTAWAGQPNAMAADAVRYGGAQLGSHSFNDGATPGNGYTAGAQTWDARVRDADPNTPGSQPYSVIFSAGNSGPNPGTLTSPHAAKNMVTVGASHNYRPGECPGVAGCGDSAEDIDALVSFSSRGPTVDNRIKPDVTAPGHVIMGSKSSITAYDCFCDTQPGGGCCASEGVDGFDKYTSYSGTSQASPRVGGASALVYDWFRDRFGPFPSPAMNKAILINGAVDMKTPDVPNNNEGWGRIHLGNSLQGPVAVQYVDQTAILGTTGDPNAYTATYVVQESTRPLKATLVWTDPPGAVSCNPCLVNDLDLLVTQGATTWRGNNFTAGFTNTGATPDTRNNVEGINLAGGSLSCASFQVKVRAQTLAGDGVPGNADATDQDFALVVANAGPSGIPAMKVTASSLVAGCDADPFLDRAETATLNLTLGNAGCAGATGVQATVGVDAQPPGAGITVSPPGAESIGSVASGGSAPHAWQVTLPANAASFCGQKVRFRVDMTDASARSWTEYVDVTLDADGSSLVTNTDPATTDESFSRSTEWNLDNCRTTSSPTSWHMGQGDCTGIPRDASAHDLIFAFNLNPGDVIRALSFRHAFNGYSNASFNDSVRVDIDPENDGSFVTLQRWRQGIDNPTVMTLAGPYNLTPYNAARAATIKIRFRFQSAANWVGGANNAPGWDVDDIVFEYDAITCDPDGCAPPPCNAPSSIPNNTASDGNICQVSGVTVTWAQDAGAWGDSGGTRTYTVLRDGSPVASGPCSGAKTYGTTSCTDTTAVPGTSYTYQVRYNNGCGQNAATAGAAAADAAGAAPSGLGNNTASDPDGCSGGRIDVAWAQDPAAWGDSGGTRTYTVLRDGSPVASGPCSGALAYGTTSCADTTVAPGASHTYQVRYNNGCGLQAATAGSAETDAFGTAPSGMPNNGAADADTCFTSGINVSWAQDAAPWGDPGGARSYTVLRNGSPVASGPCSGAFPYGTTSCTDTTTATGVSYSYQVVYTNGCAIQGMTAGVSASDVNCAPPPVNDGSAGGNPLRITVSGGNTTLTWDASAGATRYNVYMGAMGTYWSHAIFSAAGLDGADSCFEPSTSATFATPSTSAYFLVASDNGIVESALGPSTPQTPRPYASPACSPH
jgi:hypothetical protein